MAADGDLPSAGSAGGGFRRRWQALGRAERVLLILLVVTLALVPAFLTGKRSSTYRSHVVLVQVSPAPAGSADPVAAARLQVNSPVWQLLIAARAGRQSGVLPAARRVEVRRGADGSIVLTVPGSDPAGARRLADQIGSGLARQTRTAVESRKRVARQVATIDRALAVGGLTATRRRRLVAKRRFTTVALHGQRRTAALAVQHRATTPSRNALDRTVAAVYAGDAATPTALWAGIAGLLLGLALTGVWLVARDAAGSRPLRA